jgi:hypothetical protein
MAATVANRLNKLQIWMSKATPEEKQALAHAAQTTLGTLRQVAGAYRTNGALSVSADLAAKIECATVSLAARNPKLPIILRTQLCPTCAGCDYAKASLKK